MIVLRTEHKLALRLLFLPCLLGLLDVAVTLHYQTASYWSGYLADAQDGNPLVLLALRIDPWLMLPGTLAWFVIGWFLLCHTAAWVALRAYLILLTGHTIGAGGWLWRYHPQGAFLYLLLGISVVTLGYWAILPYWRHWNAEETLGGLSRPDPIPGMSKPAPAN